MAQTPPSAHVSRIISSSPHRPTILKPNAAQYFNTVSRRPILKYWTTLSFNMADPRSKIARDSWGRILDHGSWICYIEIQYGLKNSIWPPWIQDSFQESRAILDLGSWIRHIEIQYGLNISIWPSLNPRFLPGVPCNLRSWILDPPYWNSTCFNFSMWSCALLGFVVSTAFVIVCMCTPAASKKQTN